MPTATGNPIRDFADAVKAERENISTGVLYAVGPLFFQFYDDRRGGIGLDHARPVSNRPGLYAVTRIRADLSRVDRGRIDLSEPAALLAEWRDQETTRADRPFSPPEHCDGWERVRTVTGDALADDERKAVAWLHRTKLDAYESGRKRVHIDGHRVTVSECGEPDRIATFTTSPAPRTQDAPNLAQPELFQDGDANLEPPSLAEICQALRDCAGSMEGLLSALRMDRKQNETLQHALKIIPNLPA